MRDQQKDAGKTEWSFPEGVIFAAFPPKDGFRNSETNGFFRCRGSELVPVRIADAPVVLPDWELTASGEWVPVTEERFQVHR